MYRLFDVSAVCRALAEGCGVGFLSSRSHSTVDFSIQKTRVHVSWNKHRSFSVCFPLSTALSDRTHLAVCVGFAGYSGALEHRLGWSALCFQPRILLHLHSPVMVWFSFPPNLSPHFSLQLETQPHASGKAQTSPPARHGRAPARCSEAPGSSREGTPARCPHITRTEGD